jgi:hypothetical protein
VVEKEFVIIDGGKIFTIELMMLRDLAKEVCGVHAKASQVEDYEYLYR